MAIKYSWQYEREPDVEREGPADNARDQSNVRKAVKERTAVNETKKSQYTGVQAAIKLRNCEETIEGL